MQLPGRGPDRLCADGFSAARGARAVQLARPADCRGVLGALGAGFRQLGPCHEHLQLADQSVQAYAGRVGLGWGGECDV